MSKGEDLSKSIYQEAELFRKATLLISKEISRGNFLVVPYVVNAAFTLELYFKCIRVIEVGKFSRGHNLYELFNLLSKENKDFLEAKYNELASKDPILRAAMFDLKHRHGTEIRIDIQSVLKDIAFAFEQWRYCFEQLPGGFPAGGDLIEASRYCIIKLRPELDEGKGPIG